MLCRIFCIIILAIPLTASSQETGFQAVECEGRYKGHLQGICTNEKDAIYWSFTVAIVKTDTSGKILKRVDVKSHAGDLCHHDGKIYVAMNFGRFNDTKGNADNWIYVFDADDLSLLAKHKTPEVTHGAGGMAYHKGRFFVIGGLPEGVQENYVYEYDRNFKFIKKHVLPSGYTRLGIQTATFADGHFWFGCYGKKLLKTDANLKLVGKYDFDCALGIIEIGSGKFLVGRGRRIEEKGYTGRTVIAVADEKRGLVLEK